MKKNLLGLLLLLFVVLFSCSKAPTTPQDQLALINEMLSKGYEMTDNQRDNINDQVTEAKDLLTSGKQEEASKIMAAVITELEVIAETDRFNKSE
jgi:hypothetical protein